MMENPIWIASISHLTSNRKKIMKKNMMRKLVLEINCLVDIASCILFKCEQGKDFLGWTIENVFNKSWDKSIAVVLYSLKER